VPNPYPWQFVDLAEGCPAGSVILDLGSGGRSMPGVTSMEYAQHPNNDLQGDCLALPFRDSCADLILSQAVIEHVTRPEQAFSEMFRVLKPGGLLYVEVAFMQPVHMNPHHYFNVTPNGLAWLLRDWEVIEQGTVGTAHEVLAWIRKAYGLGLPRGADRVSQAKYWWAASGVSALARRPL
jgi:SAM-dependent methyltransferase